MAVVYYINLDYRTDRLAEIEEEIKDLPYPKHRISAIHTPGFGAIGCSLSHIRALETFLESEYDYCYIFEDDFKFIRPVSEIVLPSEWDVVMLSGNVNEIEGYNDIFDKAISIWTTSGYIVNKSFVPKLLTNMREGVNLLQKSLHKPSHALDVYWGKLQRDSKWYIFKERFGVQRKSWSDVENWVADYNV